MIAESSVAREVKLDRLMRRGAQVRVILLLATSIMVGCAEGTQSVYKRATLDDSWDTESDENCGGSFRTKAELNAHKGEILTVEESLGVACRSPYYRARRWHLCRGVNSEVLPRIVEILGDREQVDIWPSSVESLAFVGTDAEALVLEKLLLRRYSATWSRGEKEAFEAAFLSLGLMARRGVPEARRIVDCFYQEHYWTETTQPWFRNHPLGEHAMARVSAIHGKLFADWQVDEMLCRRLEAENPGFAGYADAKHLNDSLCRMSVEEMKPITLEERNQVYSFYERHFLAR
jgi:hypothetical protein